MQINIRSAQRAGSSMGRRPAAPSCALAPRGPCALAPSSPSAACLAPTSPSQRLLALPHSAAAQQRSPTRLLATTQPRSAGSTPPKITVPSNKVASKLAIDIWHHAEAVCFDCDCTITVNDTLDLLAEFMGVRDAVAEITVMSMEGTMGHNEALEERLKILNCKPEDIKKFVKANPPATRLTKGVESLIKSLHKRGVAVYMISGGFRELMMPIAEYLGIPKERVFANRMLWQWDDDTLEPTRLAGFDMSEPMASSQGKQEAMALIRKRNPYNGVVMIGDGANDLQAVEASGGTDLFIGYGGVTQIPAVVMGADWYVTDHAVLEAALKRYQVAMIGSGSWGTAAIRMVAQNTLEDPLDEFVENIPVWVRSQELEDSINNQHLNPQYLPGVDLPHNMVAEQDLIKVVENADVIVLCTPHQYVRGLCKQMSGHIKPGAIAISLTKGMSVRNDGVNQLVSQMITRYLGIDCCVLMGANLADGIGREELSEAVIGYNSLDNARTFKKLFERPYFKVNLLPDVAGAEMCGTLKNIVALGAGFVDGLGQGPNTKSAILREGLAEMKKFSQALYPKIRDDTFLESCGMADLVATCYGGRNRKVAMAFAAAWKEGKPETFDALEAQLLNGQKLQGVLTSDEVQEIIKTRNWEQDYPLFTTINRIVNGQLDVTYITRYVDGSRKVIPVPAPPEPEVPVPKGRRFASLQLSLS